MADVAIAVGDSLRRAGIRAVLTGGACAHLYSRGAYASLDADFVLSGTISREDLDEAMNRVGFHRKGDRYIHRSVPFFVEFPRGPLGIGQDLGIRPVWRARGGARTLSLSATDACRDRLAAFYHWGDRQALAAAVAIASRSTVRLAKVRQWSETEGHGARYASFLAELAESRRSSRRKGK